MKYSPRDYKYFLKKWRQEIVELRRRLFDVSLTSNQRAYIKGQIEAIETVCETFAYVFI
jgi:hypothetical protein